MENLDRNEWIEQYLEGKLQPADVEAFEARLATDKVLRADLELQRQLHQELADPKKLELRDLLAEIFEQEPVPMEEPATQPRWKRLAILAALLIGMWAVWQWIQPKPDTLPTPPIQNEQTPPQNQGTTPPDTLSNPSVKTLPEPIAMVDKAKFKPNPTFESRLGNGGIRDISTAQVYMQSPTKEADFISSKGVVNLQFKGKAVIEENADAYELQLNIYDNQSSTAPIAQLLPITQKSTKNTLEWALSLNKSLRLAQGLYYFTLEQKSDAELIFVGKFSVDKNEADKK